MVLYLVIEEAINRREKLVKVWQCTQAEAQQRFDKYNHEHRLEQFHWRNLYRVSTRDGERTEEVGSV